MTIEDHIWQNASDFPGKTAVVCGGESCNYEELKRRIEEKAGELSAKYPPGRIVCLRAFPDIDFLVTYFALHKAGCAAAPLEKDIPEAAFERISAEMAAHSVPEGTADILYTTGTTGKSKGVVISHRTIIADAENLIAGMGFSHDLAFVVNGPLNHIGSLSKVYPVLMLGGTLIIVNGLKDFDLFFGAFDYPAGKFATFLVPASIRILLQFCPDRLAKLAGRMDFIETGAAAMSQSDMEALCRLLPSTRMYNTYASTETGIISTYDFNDGKCVAGCLGRPMPHSFFSITEKGLLVCGGDTLMTGYLGDPENTAAILRDGLIHTSDIGVIDEEGMLHLLGREDDVINVGGFKVSPTEVEDAALSFPGIRDCVCIAVESPITGQALKLLAVTADGEKPDWKALARHLKTKLETYKIPMNYGLTDKVCRTFNGKIDRKHYRNNG